MKFSSFPLLAVAALFAASETADAQGLGTAPKPPVATTSGTSGSVDVTVGPAIRGTSSKPEARRASGDSSLLGKVNLNGTGFPAGSNSGAIGIPQPKSAQAGAGLGAASGAGAASGQVPLSLSAVLYGQSLTFDLPLERGVVDVVVLARRDLLIEFAAPRGRLLRHMLRASSSASAQIVRFPVLQSGLHRIRLQSIRPGLTHPALRARERAEPVLIEVRKHDAAAGRTRSIREATLRSEAFDHWTEIVDRPNPLDPQLRQEQSRGAQGGSSQTGGTGKIPGKGGASGKV